MNTKNGGPDVCVSRPWNDIEQSLTRMNAISMPAKMANIMDASLG
jgi:hypothetical protein